MTLMNTVVNFGARWPRTACLYIIESLTLKECIGGTANGLSCNNNDDAKVIDINVVFVGDYSEISPRKSHHKAET